MYNLHTFVVLKNTCFNIPQLSHSTYFFLFLKFSMVFIHHYLIFFCFSGWWLGGGGSMFESEDLLGFCFKSEEMFCI